MMTADRIGGGFDPSEITPWAKLKWRVEKENEYPTEQELADVIREVGVPLGWASDYVAGRLDGSAKRGRGQPKKTYEDKLFHWYRVDALAGKVRYQEAVYKWAGQKAPRGLAIKAVAKECGIRERKLMDLLKDRKKVPHWLRTFEPTLVVATEVVALAAEGIAPNDYYPPVLHWGLKTDRGRKVKDEDALSYVRSLLEEQAKEKTE